MGSKKQKNEKKKWMKRNLKRKEVETKWNIKEIHLKLK